MSKASCLVINVNMVNVKLGHTVVSNCIPFVKLCCSFSVAYADLKTCLKKYVTGCVKDDPLLKDMAGQITKLLLLQAYNCGDQTVDLSDIHDFLWLVTKCKPERVNKALDCWNDFHSVFNQSRNDVFKLCE